jgi:peptidoglycan hydrolase-like protein with peptidoglycan-binding domain
VPNELENIYGAHCKSELVQVRAFGHEFPFQRAGANALLRAAMDAYDGGYGVYSIWAYNCRATTGGTSWSAHAWGAAVDINPDKNPYSSKARLITDMPDRFVSAFKRHGFGWGGDWHSVKDPMHMSLAPSEQGKAVKETFDPGLQAKANAKWAGRSSAPTPTPKEAGTVAPPWEHEHPGNIKSPHNGCQTVQRWQDRMAERGWEVDVDGDYGPASEQVCRAFQREKNRTADGILGPDTWRCAWECPVT